MYVILIIDNSTLKFKGDLTYKCRVSKSGLKDINSETNRQNIRRSKVIKTQI